MIISKDNNSKDIEDMAKLLMEGFGGKLSSLKLPGKETEFMLRCLADHIMKYHWDNLIIIRDKKILGTLFIKPKKWNVSEISTRLFKKLRLRSFLKASIFLWMLDHSTKRKEIHIDFLVVSESNRGMGIGGRLIETLKSRVDADQYITLFVSATNVAARRLYEKQDFQIKRKGTSAIGASLHGIRNWCFMEWRGSCI
ncbi:GNAT family N-acetyltransferase [Terribacillus saccharophilus]|uniref:GNAT family N-acetyltransferase n=1 Tax=Terribacillus saccharophilus TaxID=361277 RepID=UPI002DCFE607|nr:N-acetyltransferase [Terribacillus saccharophilus]MEC0289895.1 N-acetyltransferase [Terribacillus saccharophilus]